MCPKFTMSFCFTALSLSQSRDRDPNQSHSVTELGRQRSALGLFKWLQFVGKRALWKGAPEVCMEVSIGDMAAGPCLGKTVRPSRERLLQG